MKNMRLTGKQLRLLITLISVTIFVYTYSEVYTKNVAKTSEAITETKSVKQQIENLNQQIENEETFKKETENINQQMDEILNRFPVYIAKEDNLMFLEQLENTIDVVIPSTSLADSTTFYTSVLPARAEQDKGDGTKVTIAPDEYMSGLQCSININFQTTYEGFKELTKYITNYPDKTVIDSASISYDSSTGELMGTMMIYRYALTGTGKVYEPPYIGDINIGTDNIFGTSGE